MNPGDERDMDQMDWMAAANTVEGRTLKHHGEERQKALAQHHKNVTLLIRKHGWKIASYYDRRTRELQAGDPTHDMVNTNLGLVVDSSIAIKNEGYAHPSSLNAPPYYPSFISSPPSSLSTSYPRQFIPYEQTGRQPQHFTPYNQSGRPPRPGRPPPKCFRCGVVGHTAGSCASNSTTANLPCAPWIAKPGSRSGHLLDRSSGQSFCFNWTSSSSCRIGDRCRNIHKCAICGDSQHGANSCRK